MACVEGEGCKRRQRERHHRPTESVKRNKTNKSSDYQRGGGWRQGEEGKGGLVVTEGDLTLGGETTHYTDGIF